MPKKFTVTIEETISEGFEIEAETAEEALEIAEKEYKAGNFVVYPEQPISRQMAVTSPDGETSEWQEF